MARRRRSAHRHYARSNPLSDTELIVGGLVGVAILGLGGYLVYTHYNALPAGSTAPGGTVSSVSTDANGNTLINGYPVASSS